MYIRLVFDDELETIRTNRELRGANCYPPYSEGAVVCLFETENIPYILSRYGEACASTRCADRQNGVLNCTILLIDPPKLEDLEIDQSQNGWPESRAYHGAIPIANIRILGTASFSAPSEAMITFRSDTLNLLQQPLEL